MVNLCGIVLFNNYKLTINSGKHLAYNNHAQIVSLMYNKLTSSKKADNLYFGFD